MEVQSDDLWGTLTEVAIENPRYRREAYLFVLNGIQWSFEQLGRRRHLTGEEFTELLVAYARSQFGDFAPLVFREWGIYQTLDLGRIVYRLIDLGLMSRRDEDCLDDFRDVLNLDRALRDPKFVPGILE